MLSFITQKQSCWDKLKSEKRPIFLYGMGNGSLKIMKVLKELDIPLEGVFASDEFVRGHSFEGYVVKKLSELEACYKDFVILLGFGAGYPSLIERIKSLAEKYTLYVPDVPLFGEGLFNYEYCLNHADELEKTYSLLVDKASKKVFSNIIDFKISGDIKFLEGISTPKSEIYTEIINPISSDIYLDLGAYIGDTLKEVLQFTNGNLKKAIAIEPDKKNFKRLSKYVNSLDNSNIEIYNYIAWNKDTSLYFSTKAGRQGQISESGDIITARSIDSMLENNPVSIIKIDVEGAEKEAIEGSANTIRNFKPKLMVSLYHRNEDIFSILLQINEIYPNYKFYMRRQPYFPAWETNLYAIPN